jgi:predicted glycogen debranching enzyme
MDPTVTSELSFEDQIGREWLAVNHLGGYASSTLCCLNTRKYHGLLVAATKAPVGRTVVLSRVEEFVQAENTIEALAANEYPGTIHPEGFRYLAAFSGEPYPRWAYRSKLWTIEKSLQLLQDRNAVLISYSVLTAAGPVELEVRPLMALRPIHALGYQHDRVFKLTPTSATHTPPDSPGQSFTVSSSTGGPDVHFAHDGTAHGSAYWYLNQLYRREEQRGYACLEDLWSPCVLKWTLTPGQTVHLVCSLDPLSVAEARGIVTRQASLHDRHRLTTDPNLQLLTRAAGKFLARAAPAADANTPLQRVHSDFPWGAPSIRSALLGLTGLTLVPGFVDECEGFLRYCASEMQAGQIPSDLDEFTARPLFRGVDTSLLFIHAAHDYLRYTSPTAGAGPHPAESFWLDLFEKILASYDRPLSDLASGESQVAVDGDGLLVARAKGDANTWMDAKINDWVVTPRAGRPVGLNALWYSALTLTAARLRKLGRSVAAGRWESIAHRVKASFPQRFWNAATETCFDVVDDAWVDDALRPDQLFAISLPYPVLDDDRAAKLLKSVRTHLLTPYGLRTLAPSHSAYMGRYEGNVLARDRAAYNGCVHPFLLAYFIRATIRLAARTPDASATAKVEARELLDPLLKFARNPGQGLLPELFSGDTPHHPGGAIASARSVGALLQTYAEDILGQRPNE